MLAYNYRADKCMISNKQSVSDLSNVTSSDWEDIPLNDKSSSTTVSSTINDGLRRRSFSDKNQDTSDKSPSKEVYLPVFNIGMNMVSRVHQALTNATAPNDHSSANTVGDVVNNNDVMRLKSELNELRNHHATLNNHFQQAKTYMIYYQTLHQQNEKQLSSTVLNHNQLRERLEDDLKKAQAEIDRLSLECDGERSRKVEFEEKLKCAQDRINHIKNDSCADDREDSNSGSKLKITKVSSITSSIDDKQVILPGHQNDDSAFMFEQYQQMQRNRNISVSSCDNYSEVSYELQRANEMIEVLRTELKRSEEQLAARSITSCCSDDEDAFISQDDLVRTLRSNIDKLKRSREKKITQLLQLTDALHVAQVNCVELKNNLKKIAPLRRESAELQSKLDERNTQVDCLQKSEKLLLDQQVEDENLHGRKIKKMRKHHQKEMSAIQLKLQEIEAENRAFEAELDVIKLQQQQRNSSNDDGVIMLHNCDVVTGHLSGALDDLSTIEMKFEQLEQENEKLREEMAQFETLRREEISGIRGELEECENEIKSKDATCATLRRECGLLRDEKSIERKNSDDIIDQLREQYENKCRQLKREIDEQNEVIRSCREDKSRDDVIIEQLREQCMTSQQKPPTPEEKPGNNHVVVTQPQVVTSYDEENRAYAHWCEKRLHHMNRVCSLMHDDISRLYDDALQWRDEAIRLRHNRAHHHHYSRRHRGGGSRHTSLMTSYTGYENTSSSSNLLDEKLKSIKEEREEEEKGEVKKEESGPPVIITSTPKKSTTAKVMRSKSLENDKKSLTPLKQKGIAAAPPVVELPIWRKEHPKNKSGDVTPSSFLGDVSKLHSAE